ncbi:hypothetical protein [Leifsonia aquatica]|uniref:hypothetical protein n=1 Tax=Leifsonia aquatica TaxID=144185 RepID=UPI0037F203C9
MTATSSIDINNPITLVDGTEWMFAQRGGAVIRLRSQADGSYRDFHIGELTRQVAGMPKSFAPSSSDFRHLPTREKTRVEKLAGHVEEVLTGVNPNCPDVRNPRYSTTLSQNTRVASKQNELGVSRATMMRYVKVFREQGALGLADARTIRQHGPLANFDERVVEMTQRELAANEKKSNVTRAVYIENITAALEREHGVGTVKMPSRATWYRLLGILGAGKYAFTDESTKTKMSHQNRPSGVLRTRKQCFAGAEVQIDSTPMDILVRTKEGPRRVILTVMVDRATRIVLAHTFRLEAARSVDHAFLVGQALTPRQNQPDRTEFRELIRRLNPDVPLMDETERALQVARAPFIRPVEVVVDNGKDFLGGAFRHALEMFGIGVRFSAPHTPTSKPLVERNFGSIASIFLQYLDGYIGRSPEHRGYKVDEQALLDIFALHEAFDDWLLKFWNHRTHKGLSDPMFPTVKLTPYEAYLRNTDLTNQLATTLTRDDYIRLLPMKHHVIGTTGVAMNGRYYDSPLLNDLRHTKSGDPRHGGKWRVHWDPYNGTYVWVLGPDGQWIECISRDQAAIYEPFLNGSEDFTAEEEDEDFTRNLVAAIDNRIKGVPQLGGLITAADTLQLAEATDDTEHDFDTSMHTL